MKAEGIRIVKNEVNGLPVVQWYFPERKLFSGMAASQLRDFYKANDILFREFSLCIQDTECGINSITIHSEGKGTKAFDNLISAFFSTFKEVKASNIKYIAARSDIETVEVGINFGDEIEVGGVTNPHRVVLEDGTLAEDKDWLNKCRPLHRKTIRSTHIYQKESSR